MIELGEEVVERVASAIDSGNVLTAAYVDEAGKPRIAFYGSTHVCGTDQLALWVRNPDSTLLKTLAERPHMAFIYGDVSNRIYYTFEGRGRASATDRERVYEGIHPVERKYDPDKNGVAVVVDLDRFTSLGVAGKVVQER
ncbi:MAG: pyridoxamine 5'-phosphate oxidase family protein [Pseudomonadales bacterium]